VKANKEFMEAAGYNWVKASKSQSLGYWRKPANSAMKSAKTVNKVMRDAVTKALDGMPDCGK
jgi:hypothetical protein